MKKTLFSVMAIVLCLGLMGGAFAYFSDTETSTGNTFTAGTLDLELSGSDGNALWVSPTNWEPGDVVTATLRLKNIGSTGAVSVFFRPTALVEIDNLTPESEPTGSSNNIADWINVTQFQLTFKDSGTDATFMAYGNWAPGWMATCGAWGTTLPLTLREFNSSGYWVVIWGSSRSDDALEANGTDYIELEMTFQFEPTAPNDYQGDQCTMEFGLVTAGVYPANATVIWESGSPPGYGYVITSE